MTNKIKGFTDTRNTDSVNNTAYFEVEKIESVTEWAVRFKPLNHYFYDGKPIEHIVIARYGKSARAIPEKIEDLVGQEIDIKAKNVAYEKFYDYQEHVVVVDKYTIVKED
ncbi:hypothetical protein GIX82_11420 [Lactobacillus reuteri]|nr:hypothetical protein [Limosilactobacillus reuteri]